MQARETSIPGVATVTPERRGDDRGFLCELWSPAQLAALGIDAVFVQENLSRSRAAGTLRGLHRQAPPHEQGKLVRCARGAILDVAVDARPGSATYGRWVAEELTEENGRQLWVPRGFLHGFLTLTPDTEVVYLLDAPYRREAERAVRYDDPDLAIDWGLGGATPILSDKDAAAPPFEAAA